MSSIETSSVVFGHNVPLDPAEVAAALTRAAPWLDANLRHVSDPSARVKGLTWTVGDVAAHLAAVADGYRNRAEGGPPVPQTIAQRQHAIDADLARISERRPAILADRIRDDIEALSAVVASSRPGQVVNWYSGTHATPAFLGAAVVEEMLVHGWDIATTSHGDTTLDPGGSRLGMLMSAAACILFMTPKGKTVAADLEYRLRGYETFGLRLDNGHLDITTQPMPDPDLWFEGEPGPLLLMGFRQQLEPLLNGSIRIGGRRPELALTAAEWFETA